MTQSEDKISANVFRMNEKRNMEKTDEIKKSDLSLVIFEYSAKISKIGIEVEESELNN
jgi:hypothetical protein